MNTSFKMKMNKKKLEMMHHGKKIHIISRK